MEIIKPSHVWLNPERLDAETHDRIISEIASAARVCYKSQGNATVEKDLALVRNICKRNHEAMLEFANLTVQITCDRGVSHELVRHRMCSFAQESTRYVNYQKRGGIAFIEPHFNSAESYDLWRRDMSCSEDCYNALLAMGESPEMARTVLPSSTATVIDIRANLREWRHILALRAYGTTGAPHPQMVEVMKPIADELSEWMPEVFSAEYFVKA